MSLSNLLQPNNYNVFTGALESPEIVIYNESDDTKKVELSSDTNNTLVIGPNGSKGILANNIQFDVNQDVLNYYSVLTSSEASALEVVTPIGTTFALSINQIRITRIGNLVTIILPILSVATIAPNYGNITSTFQLASGIPSRFRPLIPIDGICEYYTTSNGSTLGVININTSGIIKWEPGRIAGGSSGVWQSTPTATTITVFRNTISYVI